MPFTDIQAGKTNRVDTYRYYCISEQPNLMTIEPTLLLGRGKSIYRVALFNSIDKLMSSINKEPYKYYYVYIPHSVEYSKFCTPRTATFDNNSEEVWAYEPLKVRLFATIRIQEDLSYVLVRHMVNESVAIQLPGEEKPIFVESVSTELHHREIIEDDVENDDISYEDDEEDNINESFEEDIETYETLNNSILSGNDSITFELPDMDKEKPDLQTLLDNTDPKHIYLTSDWHFFKNHYKKEANYVNTQKIVAWCMKNIKDDDVFMYLGDISFRYANAEDQAESQKILSKIPGKKVLILGNHDKMLGQEYFTGCGFDYVFDTFTYNDLIFTHQPINMDTHGNMLNIHGHIHKWEEYMTTDGKKNLNVYPYFFNNKPVTLDYLLNHVEELVKNHKWKPNAGYSESTVSESDINSYKYYHLSLKDDIKILNPKIPKNYMTDNNYEENKTPRVCFSPSINQCLMAMAANIKNKEFYVYTPEDTDNLINPTISQVPDSKITGEVWSLKPIKVKLIGKIKIIGDSDKKGYSYTYGNNKKAELYDFNYMIISETSLTSKVDNNHFYFYHYAPKKLNGSKGIISPKYMYDNNMTDLFHKATDKYRDRLVNGWEYYPNKKPEELTDEEIINGINKFRKSTNGLSQIYFFKYKLYPELGPKIKEFLKTHDCYRIDLNDSKTKALITDIDWGYDFSNSDNTILDKSYYENISKEEYFSKYNDQATINFAAMNHISITFKNNYCPMSILTKVSSNNINEITNVLLELVSNNPKPVVYYSPVVDSKTIAYMVSLFQDRIGESVAIKTHFGETGNQNFLNPKLLKDTVKCTNAALVDSNTAYEGSTRGTTSEHLDTAMKHGFGDIGYIDILDSTGDINVSVPNRYKIARELERLSKGEIKPFETSVTPGDHLTETFLGSHITNYDTLIVFTHFKGHSIAGYGGAVKNIGMGIPSGNRGKKLIHGKNWEGGPLFLERLVESASAVNAMFENHVIYINVLQNMSTMCDCDKDAPKATIPNLGVLVSTDLVAIEQASLDMIRNAPKNKDLMEQIASKGGYHQIEYMKWLEMGTGNYILRDLNNNRIQLESVIFEEESKDDDILKEIFEFNKTLNSYEYIIPNNGNIITHIKNDDFMKYYKVLSPAEFEKYHGGVCWDYVIYEAKYFKEHFKGISFNTYFNIIDNKTTCPTHTFLLFNYKGKTYWFESSWKSHRGIYEFNSEKAALDCINRELKNSESLKKYDSFLFKYNALDSSYIGNDCETFMNKMINYINKNNLKPYKASTDSKLNRVFTSDIVYESANDSFKFVDATKSYISKHKDDFSTMKDLSPTGGNWNSKCLEKDGELIGCISVYHAITEEEKKSFGDRNWINNLEIKPSERNNGYGTKLLNYAIHVMKGNALMVRKSNKAAITLYEKVGFKKKEANGEYITYILKSSSVNEAFYEAAVEDESISESIRKIHTEYKKYNNGGKAGNQNCLLCTWCLEARIRGFDLLPRPVYSPRDKSLEMDVLTIISNPKIKFSNIKEIKDIIMKAGDGSRFYIHVNWKGCTGGHEFLLINQKNKIYVADAQAGIFTNMESDSGKEYFNIDFSNSYIVRLDNKDCNISLIKSINNKSNIIEWDDKKDVEYMKKHNMLSEKDLAELDEAAVARKDLPDSAFGIPEDRKFPLDTEAHVKAAIKLFGHAQESKKKSLAKRIRSAAKRYDITIPETTQCYKYLSEAVIEPQIDTIIFDFGGVLVDADLRPELKKNPNIPDELCDQIFNFIYEYFFSEAHRPERVTQMLDVKKALKVYESEAPEDIASYGKEVFSCFKNMLFKYDYVDELLDLLKSKGYKIYYLSNWHQYSLILEQDFFKKLVPKFDGGIFSFEINDMKPSPMMYKALIDRYKIDPSKALFFDDRGENVEGAKAVGLNAEVWERPATVLKIFSLLKKDISATKNETILGKDHDGNLITIDTYSIDRWFISNIPDPFSITTYSTTIAKAIEEYYRVKGFDNMEEDVYLFVSSNSLNKDPNSQDKPVCVGKIHITSPYTFEWDIQYPVNVIDGEIKPMKEFSMASVNPVIGRNRCFMINTGEKMGVTNDIEPERMLVKDGDNLVIEPVGDAPINEVYEFIGDPNFVRRLNRMYIEQAETDKSLYELLTNKVLYSEDQIDFDTDNFRKISKELMYEQAVSKFATLRDEIVEAINPTITEAKAIIETAINKTTPSFVQKYNVLGDIVIKEDFDGVFFYSELSHKRSGSVKSTDLLTENMLISIL